MTLRLGITQRGLILISVPLIIGTIIMLRLSSLLDESAHEIQKEARSKAIIACVEGLLRDVARATVTAITYNVSHSEDLKFRYSALRARIPVTYRELKELVKGDQEEELLVKRLWDSIDTNWLATQSFIMRSPPLQRMSDFFAVPDNLTYEMFLLNDLGSPGRTLLERERRIERGGSFSRAQIRQHYEQTLIFSLVMSAGVSVLLAFYFTKSISQRLDYVMANTFRWSLRLPLNPPVGGTDEISELDLALHKTAGELSEFERFKGQLISVASHELRTPLTALQGTLTLLSAGALGELSERAVAKVEEAEVSIKRLIRLVNDLLDLERLKAGKAEWAKNKVYVQEIVQSAAESVDDLLDDRQIELKTNVSDALIIGDRDKLVLMFGEILAHSIRRSPPDTVITVSSVWRLDNLYIDFHDEGAAVTGWLKDKLFEPFYNINDLEATPPDLNGLELALAKGIAEHYGGGLTAVADEEGRNILSLRLPAEKVKP